MPQDHKYPIQRVAEDSPERCQGINAHGQCTFARIPGLDYCSMHAGAGKAKIQKEARRKYRVEAWNRELEGHANDSEIKNLREEIGILRLLITKRLEVAKTSEELILQSNALGQLVGQLSKLVQDAHKLEKSIGDLLDRKQLVELMDQILIIITKYVTDPIALEQISNELTQLEP